MTTPVWVITGLLDSGKTTLINQLAEPVSYTHLLSKIASNLADNDVSIFAVSTYNTNYILIKKENY